MDQSTVETTRRGLHAVAELVLAGPQYRRSGTVKLLVSPGGFQTSTELRLRVEGVELVTPTQRLTVSGLSCAQLADAAGVDVGEPEGLYHDGSGAGPGDVVHLDPQAASWIESCWAAGDAALRQLAPDQQPYLWPEHLDVGVLADGFGYGVSPGDKSFPEPYAYVNPPSSQAAGAFWNAPFGAARLMRDLDGGRAEAVLAFFVEGRERAEADPIA